MRATLRKLLLITLTALPILGYAQVQDDPVDTDEDTPVTFSVVANDSDPDVIDAGTVDLDPSTPVIDATLTTPEGTYSVSATGEVTFTPTPDFFGLSVTQYTVQNQLGNLAGSATITITVNSVNDTPIALGDAVATLENTPVSHDVTENDVDIDGTIDASTVDLNVFEPGVQNTFSNPEGSFSVNAGIVTFMPVPFFSGSTNINYVVQDNEGGSSDEAPFTVTVINTNDSPVATDDSEVTLEDTPVSFNILENDTDDSGLDQTSVDFDPAAGTQAVYLSAEGTFEVTDGSLTFTPGADFHGTATATYVVNDTEGVTSNQATITIIVSSVNDDPVANDDTEVTNEGVSVVVAVLANDTDIDGTIQPSSIDLDVSTGGIQGSITSPSGSWTASTGMVTFDPAVGFHGTATASYTVNDDGDATSNTATISVTVSAVNTAPSAVDDAAVTSEDQPVSVNVLSNDTDDGSLASSTVDLDVSTPELDALVTGPSGSFSVDNAGLVTFTPALNYNGMASVAYTVQDDEGLKSNEATLSITVGAVNDAPTAAADLAATNEDTPVSFNLAANDSDVDGTVDATSVDLDVSNPGIQKTRTTASGVFNIDNSALLTFTPGSDFNGTATIQYNIRDNEGLVSNNASVTITVNAVNDAPIANPDATSTNEGVAVLINVVANDTDDAAINPASVDLDVSTSGVQNTYGHAAGTFTVNSSGVVAFSPVANFNGTVVIDYTVNDYAGLSSNEASITVTVNSVNVSPVATDDTGTTDEDVAVSIDVLGNDSDDVNLDPATVDVDISTPGIQSNRTTAHGSYSVDAAGVVTFTPVLNYNGAASIRYTVRDGEGANSNTATLTVSVNPVNDKPVAVNDTRTTNEDTPVAINVVSNDTDVDGSVVAATVDLDVSSPSIESTRTTAEGTFSSNGSGTVTFTPVNNYFGTATLNYAVSDNGGLTSDPATITVTVNPVNDAPIAGNDISSTDQGEPVVFNVVVNDIDVDGSVNAGTVDLNPGSAGIQTTRTVASGTYLVDGSGNVTFTPILNFSGTSSISYTVNDNAGATSNAASISVLVNFVNQRPTTVDDAATTNEDTPVSVNVLSNDSDDGSLNTTTVDLNPQTSGIQNTATANGTFSVTSGVVTYTPAPNFTGTTSVNYTVDDNIGETSEEATLTITVTSVNDAPVAANDAASTNEDVEVVISVIANDTDVDGTIDPSSVDLIPGTDAIDGTRTVSQGTFTVSAATGTVTFVPAQNFNGNASTTYNVRDNNGAKSNTATITVNVINVNDPPVFNIIDNQRVLENSAQKTVSITGISPGPSESEQLLITATSQNTSLVPHPVVTYNGTAVSATMTFKPQADQSGVAEVVVKAVDGGLNSFSRTFEITVVDVDIVSSPVTLAIPGENYQYDVAITDIPETLTLSVTQKPGWATLTSTGKNTATLAGTPPTNAVSAPVTIQLRQGATVIDQQQFIIEINRRPSASPFLVEANEDEPQVIGVENFLSSFSDPDDHPLSEVVISGLPDFGTLTQGETVVQEGDVISVAALANLTYTGGAEFTGRDTVYFQVGDGKSLSNAETYFHLVVSPVNDPPIITFMEEEPLVYDIGRELAQTFTSQFMAEEPDEGDQITGAIIGFRPPNFNPDHDVLEFESSGSISGSYDQETGVMTLTGAAPVEEYVEAIRRVKYKFQDLDDIILQPRTVYITLSDEVSVSDPRERIISLEYDFVELQVPNVFTPDGNGKNDFWRITSTTGTQQYNDAAITVFDKRGRQIFETKGFENEWDGMSDGRPVPSDTYFYTIDLKYGKVKYTGTVTILREKP